MCWTLDRSNEKREINALLKAIREYRIPEGGTLPHQPGMADDRDATAITAIFWAFGLLLAAFGVGNLICWFLIDKRRGGSGDKSE